MTNTDTSASPNESYRTYLQGPTARELQDHLTKALLDYGMHQEGAVVLTPRAMTVLALTASHKVALKYLVNNRPQTVTGMLWDIEGNTVQIVSPDNRMGSTRYDIEVDAIQEVTVYADDGLVRDRIG